MKTWRVDIQPNFPTRWRWGVGLLPQSFYPAGRAPSPDWIGRGSGNNEEQKRWEFLPGIKFFNTTWLARKMICKYFEGTSNALFQDTTPRHGQLQNSYSSYMVVRQRFETGISRMNVYNFITRRTCSEANFSATQAGTHACWTHLHPLPPHEASGTWWFMVKIIV